MNQRIKELMEEAGLYDFVIESMGINEEMNKFAELIVKECEKAIRTEIAVTDIGGEVEKAWEMGMECGVYTIKKHFGVEE